MSPLTTYKNMLNETFTSVSNAIGVHVMLIVVEHALWSIKHKYEEAGCIEFSEEGINFSALDNLDQEKAENIAHELVITIVGTLGRLVGKQLARQLFSELQLNHGEGDQ